jgi:hypothetical protein
MTWPIETQVISRDSNEQSSPRVFLNVYFRRGYIAVDTIEMPREYLLSFSLFSIWSTSPPEDELTSVDDVTVVVVVDSTTVPSPTFFTFLTFFTIFFSPVAATSVEDIVY